MVLKAENQGDKWLDRIKWSVSLLLLLAGLVGNHYYSEVSMPLRAVSGLVLLAVVGFILSKTKHGKWVIGFFQESRLELRKVVWPTREETMQTTLVVAVMVVVLALILWGLDGILVWLIGWLTGQRG